MNNLYDKIITDISKVVKKTINEAFSFDKVQSSKSTGIKSAAIAAFDYAKREQLKTIDIVRILEGLYGIPKPRGFKPDKLSICTDGKEEFPAISDYTNGGGAPSQKIFNFFGSQGFTCLTWRPYIPIMDEETTIEDYINNSFFYRRAESDFYKMFPSEKAEKEIERRGIDVDDYRTMDERMKIYKKYPSQEALDAIKNEYDKQYNKIQSDIEKWNDKFNQLPVWAQEIYKKLQETGEVYRFALSPDGGILYAEISKGGGYRIYGKNTMATITFTGKVLYTEEDGLSKEDSKAFNDARKAKNKIMTGLNKALRANKFTPGWQSEKYFKEGNVPVYLEFFIWYMEVQKNQYRHSRTKVSEPYIAHQMELGTKKDLWKRIHPTHGAEYEFRTYDNACYFRVYNGNTNKDAKKFIDKVYSENLFNDSMMKFTDKYAKTGFVEKELADSYVEIGLVEQE